MPPRPSLPADWREALIVLAAVETGLLGAFATARTPAAAAREAGLDPRAARIVTAALADLGYLEGDGGGRLALTRRGSGLVGPPGDGTDVVGGLHLEARAMRSHLALADALRDGRPVDDVSAGDPVTVERFMRAMRHIGAPRVPATVAALGPPPPGARLLDVGGAPGAYARALAAAGWEVTVLDLPAALAVAGAALEHAGIRTVAGDATEALPEGPWDALYLGNLAHLFGPEEAGALIGRAGATLRPGGLLAVQEVLGDVSPQGPAFGVMMLVSTPGGEAYPEARYREWMAAAGCAVERVVPLEEGWHHLLLGRRA
ncbi:MAG TPA: methyltransferase [Miltoncostaeaceae bacterium]|nr:methyltransferase [Miltoncostaeaceae bacterium]